MSVAGGIFGLVLSGGRSERMGRDKGAIVFPERGQDQRAVGVELLSKFCESVFVSCRLEQVGFLDPTLETILDRSGQGPVAGLLAAKAFAPGAAWLVLAIDYPLANAGSVERLVRARDPSALATAYVSAESGLIEPLFALWEPAGLRALERDRRSLGARASPRRVLERGPCNALRPRRTPFLENVNTPADLDRLRRRRTARVRPRGLKAEPS